MGTNAYTTMLRKVMRYPVARKWHWRQVRQILRRAFTTPVEELAAELEVVGEEKELLADASWQERWSGVVKAIEELHRAAQGGLVADVKEGVRDVSALMQR